MNINLVEQSIRDFINERIKIISWDLDEPDRLTYEYAGSHYPSNTAKQLPIQNLTYKRETFNRVIANAIFPYVITYRFYGELPYASLPLSSIANVLSHIQILSIIQNPHPDIKTCEVLEIEDSIVVRRSNDSEDDWLISITFALAVEFNVTSFPDIGDIQPGDYFPVEPPPELNQLSVRINRAKINFDVNDNTTYIQDSEIII
jgi:hypothetical protein